MFATATEDMVAVSGGAQGGSAPRTRRSRAPAPLQLTFGSSTLLRNLTASEARKLPVREITLDRVLTESELSMEQFIDMCIMLG